MSNIDCLYKTQIDSCFSINTDDIHIPQPIDKVFIFKNDIFECFDFYSIKSLDMMTITILNAISSKCKAQLFSDDFDFTLLYDNVLNSLLSFDEDLVLTSSRLLLTLTYLSDSAISYLSTKVSELISIFREFWPNMTINSYILNLLQSTFIEFPFSACDALGVGILDIFTDIIDSTSSERKHIKIIASIIQFITLNIDLLSQKLNETPELAITSDFFERICFDFAHKFLMINDEEIFGSALYTISHLQQKLEFPPDAIFQYDTLDILLDQLSRHKNIIPIFQVFSNFHDVQFINVLFDKNFPLIIEDIIRKENEPICIQILTYLFDQIQNNNELANHFSYIVLVLAEGFDDLTFTMKISYIRFFFSCFNYNFDFIIQQECFESIFCLIFDLFEDVSIDDLFEILSILNFYANSRLEVIEFIAQHSNCYQVIYNLCSHDDERIAQNAQNIISIIKDPN